MIEFDLREPLVVVMGDPVYVYRKNFNRIQFFDNLEMLVRDCCEQGYTTFVTRDLDLFEQAVKSCALSLSDKYPSVTVLVIPYDRVKKLLAREGNLDLNAEYQARFVKNRLTKS